MTESNSGQLISGRDGRRPKGAYTGERLSVGKEQAIINALSNGEPIERIARRLHCSKHTAMAVRERESHDIARRKRLIAASAARLAANGFDRLNAEMDAGNIKGALLVPVTGMAIDKVIALSGDTTSHLMNLNMNIQPVDVAAQFNRLTEAIKAKANEVRKQEEASIMRGQLALPGGDAIADSSAATDPQSGKGNS